MKKLPDIYKNNINKVINNNKKVCYLTKEEPISILNKINSLFKGYGYSYNIPVTIKTPNNIYHTSIIAKSTNNIITLDNDIIPLKDIIDLEINK